MAAMFRAAAMAHPGRTLAAQREAAAAGGWRTVAYGAARRQVGGLAPALVTMSGRAGDQEATAFGELAGRPATGQVDERADAAGPDTVAKILFTSGSTGHPKGVLNTHRMMCANQQMIRQAWPFLDGEP